MFGRVGDSRRALALCRCDGNEHPGHVQVWRQLPRTRVARTNAPAVELYSKLGFAIVGTLPKAFRHQQLGLVDAYGRRIK